LDELNPAITATLARQRTSEGNDRSWWLRRSVSQIAGGPG
jgi:hypothetical protein